MKYLYRVLLIGLLPVLFGVASGNADEISPTATNEGRIVASNATYTTAQGATTGSADFDYFYVGQETDSFGVFRSFMTFAIPATSEVAACVLHLDGYLNHSTTDFEIYVVSSTYSNPMDGNDFDLVGSTAWNETWNSSSYSADDNAITFNATGRAVVLAAQGGTLRMALRSLEDINISAPTGQEDVHFNINPTLTITYTLPGWAHTASGVATPANVWGVDKANISNVSGVAK